MNVDATGRALCKYKKKIPICIWKRAGRGRPLSKETLQRIDRIEWAIRRLLDWPCDEERITGWILRRRQRIDKERTLELQKQTGRNRTIGKTDSKA